MNHYVNQTLDFQIVEDTRMRPAGILISWRTSSSKGIKYPDLSKGVSFDEINEFEYATERHTILFPLDEFAEIASKFLTWKERF